MWGKNKARCFGKRHSQFELISKQLLSGNTVQYFGCAEPQKLKELMSLFMQVDKLNSVQHKPLHKNDIIVGYELFLK